MKKSSLPSVYLLVLGVGFVSGQEQPLPETTGQQEGSLGVLQNVFASISRESQTGGQGGQILLNGTSQYSEGNENPRSVLFGRNWLDSNATLGNVLPISQGRRFWTVQNITRNGTHGRFDNSTVVIGESKTIAGSLQNNSFGGNQLNGDYDQQGGILTERTSTVANLSSVRFNGYTGQTPLNYNWSVPGSLNGLQGAGGGAGSMSGLSVQGWAVEGKNDGNLGATNWLNPVINSSRRDVTSGSIPLGWNNNRQSSLFGFIPGQSIQSSGSIGDHAMLHAEGPVTVNVGTVNININLGGHEESSSAGVLNYGGGTVESTPESPMVINLNLIGGGESHSLPEIHFNNNPEAPFQSDNGHVERAMDSQREATVVLPSVIEKTERNGSLSFQIGPSEAIQTEQIKPLDIEDESIWSIGNNNGGNNVSESSSLHWEARFGNSPNNDTQITLQNDHSSLNSTQIVLNAGSFGLHFEHGDNVIDSEPKSPSDGWVQERDNPIVSIEDSSTWTEMNQLETNGNSGREVKGIKEFNNEEQVQSTELSDEVNVGSNGGQDDSPAINSGENRSNDAEILIQTAVNAGEILQESDNDERETLHELNFDYKQSADESEENGVERPSSLISFEYNVEQSSQGSEPVEETSESTDQSVAHGARLQDIQAEPVGAETTQERVSIEIEENEGIQRENSPTATQIHPAINEVDHLDDSLRWTVSQSSDVDETDEIHVNENAQNRIVSTEPTGKTVATSQNTRDSDGHHWEIYGSTTNDEQVSGSLVNTLLGVAERLVGSEGDSETEEGYSGSEFQFENQTVEDIDTDSRGERSSTYSYDEANSGQLGGTGNNAGAPTLYTNEVTGGNLSDLTSEIWSSTPSENGGFVDVSFGDRLEHSPESSTSLEFHHNQPLRDDSEQLVSLSVDGNYENEKSSLGPSQGSVQTEEQGEIWRDLDENVNGSDLVTSLEYNRREQPSVVSVKQEEAEESEKENTFQSSSLGYNISEWSEPEPQDDRALLSVNLTITESDNSPNESTLQWIALGPTPQSLEPNFEPSKTTKTSEQAQKTSQISSSVNRTATAKKTNKPTLQWIALGPKPHGLMTDNERSETWMESGLSNLNSTETHGNRFSLSDDSSSTVTQQADQSIMVKIQSDDDDQSRNTVHIVSPSNTQITLMSSDDELPTVTVGQSAGQIQTDERDSDGQTTVRVVSSESDTTASVTTTSTTVDEASTVTASRNSDQPIEVTPDSYTVTETTSFDDELPTVTVDQSAGQTQTDQGDSDDQTTLHIVSSESDTTASVTTTSTSVEESSTVALSQNSEQPIDVTPKSSAATQTKSSDEELPAMTIAQPADQPIDTTGQIKTLADDEDSNDQTIVHAAPSENDTTASVTSTSVTEASTVSQNLDQPIYELADSDPVVMSTDDLVEASVDVTSQNSDSPLSQGATSDLGESAGGSVVLSMDEDQVEASDDVPSPNSDVPVSQEATTDLAESHPVEVSVDEDQVEASIDVTSTNGDASVSHEATWDLAESGGSSVVASKDEDQVGNSNDVTSANSDADWSQEATTDLAESHPVEVSADEDQVEASIDVTPTKSDAPLSHEATWDLTESGGSSAVASTDEDQVGISNDVTSPNIDASLSQEATTDLAESHTVEDQVEASIDVTPTKSDAPLSHEATWDLTESGGSSVVASTDEDQVGYSNDVTSPNSDALLSQEVTTDLTESQVNNTEGTDGSGASSSSSMSWSTGEEETTGTTQYEPTYEEASQGSVSISSIRPGSQIAYSEDGVAEGEGTGLDWNSGIQGGSTTPLDGPEWNDESITWQRANGGQSESPGSEFSWDSDQSGRPDEGHGVNWSVQRVAAAHADSDLSQRSGGHRQWRQNSATRPSSNEGSTWSWSAGQRTPHSFTAHQGSDIHEITGPSRLTEMDSEHGSVQGGPGHEWSNAGSQWSSPVISPALHEVDDSTWILNEQGQLIQREGENHRIQPNQRGIQWGDWSNHDEGSGGQRWQVQQGSSPSISTNYGTIKNHASQIVQRPAQHTVANHRATPNSGNWWNYESSERVPNHEGINFIHHTSQGRQNSRDSDDAKIRWSRENTPTVLSVNRDDEQVNQWITSRGNALPTEIINQGLTGRQNWNQRGPVVQWNHENSDVPDGSEIHWNTERSPNLQQRQENQWNMVDAGSSPSVQTNHRVSTGQDSETLGRPGIQWTTLNSDSAPSQWVSESIRGRQNTAGNQITPHADESGIRWTSSSTSNPLWSNRDGQDRQTMGVQRWINSGGEAVNSEHTGSGIRWNSGILGTTADSSGTRWITQQSGPTQSWTDDSIGLSNWHVQPNAAAQSPSGYAQPAHDVSDPRIHYLRSQTATNGQARDSFRSATNPRSAQNQKLQFGTRSLIETVSADENRTIASQNKSSTGQFDDDSRAHSQINNHTVPVWSKILINGTAAFDGDRDFGIDGEIQNDGGSVRPFSATNRTISITTDSVIPGRNITRIPFNSSVHSFNSTSTKNSNRTTGNSTKISEVVAKKQESSPGLLKKSVHALGKFFGVVGSPSNDTQKPLDKRDNVTSSVKRTQVTSGTDGNVVKVNRTVLVKVDAS